MLTAHQLAVAARWAAADLAIDELYSAIDASSPTRVLVKAGGRDWLVELRREFFEGRPRVFARRLRVQDDRLGS